MVLVVILGVTGISGCTDSVSNGTKHFDNGVVAFDYPSYMVVSDYGIGGIDVKNGSATIVHMATMNYTNNLKSGTINDENMKNPDPGMNITKVTINGRTAYNVVQKNGNSIGYFTFIDIGTGQMQIFPSSYSDVSDQKDSPAYPIYQMIVNSFQVK